MYDNLNNYKVFYTVAKCGSISKAADVLFISQPAISKTISKLEEGLGVSVFNRNSRGVSLTEEGEVLFKHISTAFDKITSAEDEIKRINELGIGHIKIGVSTSLCKHILLDYLKDFIQDNPHIKVTIDCHSTFNTLKLLAENKVDIGLICDTTISKDMEYYPIKEIHDVFVTSDSYLDNFSVREKDDSTTTSDTMIFSGNIISIVNEGGDNIENDNNIKPDIISYNEVLERANLMLLEKGNITRNHIDEYLVSQDIYPNQILEINNMDLLIDFATIGMGIACVVREFAIAQLNSGIIIELPLEIPISERNVGFVWSKNRPYGKAVKKFMEYICER